MSWPHLQVLPNITDRNFDPLIRYLFEIRNRERWLLEMGGEIVLYYRRKREGRICPNFDKIRGQHPQIEFCPYCFGTGYVGGFYRPLEIKVSILTPFNQRFKPTEHGIKNEAILNGWTLFEPNLQNGDFIVRRDGSRWWIIEKRETRWKFHVLHQNFTAEFIEKGHSVYKINI